MVRTIFCLPDLERVYVDRLKVKVKPGRIEFSMTWSYKKQRRLLQLAAQSKSPEAIANLMDGDLEAVQPDPFL